MQNGCTGWFFSLKILKKNRLHDEVYIQLGLLITEMFGLNHTLAQALLEVLTDIKSNKYGVWQLSWLKYYARFQNSRRPRAACWHVKNINKYHKIWLQTKYGGATQRLKDSKTLIQCVSACKCFRYPSFKKKPLSCWPFPEIHEKNASIQTHALQTNAYRRSSNFIYIIIYKITQSVNVLLANAVENVFGLQTIINGWCRPQLTEISANLVRCEHR